MLRRIWRGWLGLRYRAVRRKDEEGSSGPVLENIAGRPILVLPGVFRPRLLRSGAFFVESLNQELIPVGAKVLDMGTGSGVGAVVASTWASEVCAVDVNPDAVRCARINALLNRCESKVHVAHGDLFESLADGDGPFDVVLFNPPFYRGEPRDGRDHAWRGQSVDVRFARDLKRFLASSGHVLLCLSSDGDTDFLGELERVGFVGEAVAERDLLNEVLRVYRLSRTGAKDS